jgi:hypothetical protein
MQKMEAESPVPPSFAELFESEGGWRYITRVAHESS